MKDKKNTPEEGVQLYEIGLHLISSLPEEEVQTVFSALKSDLEKQSTIISEQEPQKMDLAYTMIKKIDRKKIRFNEAYFGWIKFLASSEAVQAIDKLAASHEQILRYIIVKTVENAEEGADKIAEMEKEQAQEESEEKEASDSKDEKSKESKSDAQSSGDDLEEDKKSSKESKVDDDQLDAKLDEIVS